MAKTLTRKGVTTGRTPVLAIPVLTDDAARLLSINVINQDTVVNTVIIRIAESGTYTVLKEAHLAFGVLATNEIVFPGGLPDDGGTVTIDGKVYTWKTALTGPPSADGEVLIGISIATARNNLLAALDLSGVAGTDYGTNMAAHLSVDGVANGDDLTINAKASGPYGDAITLAEVSANLTITSPLADGVIKSELQFSNPIGISQGQSIEILLGKAATTTEFDWSAAYVLNP